MLLVCASATAQQKGQYVPGQSGLNAGVLPDPGITYTNMSIHYRADSLRDAHGSKVPATGTTEFWAIENFFFYVPRFKIAGAKVAVMAALPAANAALNLPAGVQTGAYGYADTWVQPVTLGWSVARADVSIGYAFTAPTGRYTAGANDNTGSGYWGNNLNTGTTVYLTKNRRTSLSLFTNWEGHGVQSGTNMTPGQAFTDEWGLGQVIPLASDESRLLQLGVIGYDQWQITDNRGDIDPGIPAGLSPHYQVHAVGFQSNFILPKRKVNLFFKYEPEYLAKARPEGHTVVFGASFTFAFPKSK
ncbi:MAG TPA: transporter [Candidatus Limnocylindrales bacterium]|nr:transporter [Candidatus Limnocylindrales bacterium]